MTIPDVLLTLAALLTGYLLGSIPSGLIVGRLWKDIDVREHGSGRTGATNVLRTLGWQGAGTVVVMDLAKGATAILLGAALADIAGQVAAAVAVVSGHTWPVFAGFRGGRGVAPATGAAMTLVPVSALVGIVVALVVIAASRYVSLGSLVGTAAGCSIIVAYAFLGWAPFAFAPLAIAAESFIVLAHRDNIARLVRGTERRIGQSA